MKRYRNGRYKSKRDYEIECKTRNYTIMITAFIVAFFYVTFTPWTGSYQNIVHMHEIQTVHAEEIEVIEAPVYSDKVQQAIDALSSTIEREVTDETKKRVQYLYEKSSEKNVPFFDAVKTIYCESGWIAQKSHLPEESYGLSQIHLPSHPNITQEQAMDAYFAIDYMVDNWYTEKWYGYSRSTQNCTHGGKIEL